KVLQHMRVGSSKRDGNAILLIALAVMVFGYLGVFLGRLIKAYISRQREYLADASAVQFTRLSHGLSGALMKIAAFQAGSKLTEHNGEEVAHMLFGDGVGYSRLTATHPPLIDRIKRIDPRFDPMLLARLEAGERAFEGIDEDTDPPAASALLAGFSAAPLQPAPAVPVLRERMQAPQPAKVLNDIANPGVDHVDYAVAMRQSLPPLLTTAAHMRERAIDVVLSLLLAREVHPEGSLAEISKRLGPVRAKGTQELVEAARALHAAQRIPLAQLAMPALKRRPASELRLLMDTIDTLIHSDGQVDVFEYVLARLLRQQMSESLEPNQHRGGRRKLPELRQQALSLLAVLALHGHEQVDNARRAYLAGAEILFPAAAESYGAPGNWIELLDQALPALDELVPAGKETLVLALATTVGHDGQIATAEAELLRLICTLLHCPLPPLLGE
ncbi:MAG: M48 family metalloprotease, partial [Xanthomonadales bacterium]|nr:M48 family metalloprotease [Xanthomonadales bacterium]